MLRYYRRTCCDCSRIPFFGQAQSVVLVARQPVDIEGNPSGLRTLADPAGHGRQRPLSSLAGAGHRPDRAGPDPRADRAGDDAMLREVLGIKLRRMRVVPFGLIRINLGQEAMALAHQASPGRPLHRARPLADALCERFRRFVPLIDLSGTAAAQFPRGSIEIPLFLRSGRAGIIPVERDLERLPPGVDAGGPVGVAAQPPCRGRLDRIGQLVVAGPGHLDGGPIMQAVARDHRHHRSLDRLGRFSLFRHADRNDRVVHHQVGDELVLGEAVAIALGGVDVGLEVDQGGAMPELGMPSISTGGR